MAKKSVAVSAATREVQKVVKTMSPELREKFDEVSKIMADTEQAVIVAWFKVSKHILEVCENPDKYGGEKKSDAIQLLAAALNVSKSELYARRMAALQWTETEIKRLSEARGPRGPAITTSMLQLLTQVDNTARRKKLADKIVSEGLTVEALRKALKMGSDSGSVAAGVSLLKNPVASVTAMSKTLSKYGEFHERLDGIVKKISDFPDKYANNKTLEILEAASNQLEQAEQSTQRDRRAIDAALDTLRRTVAADAATESDEEEEEAPKPLRLKKKKKKKKPAAEGAPTVDRQDKENTSAVHATRLRKLRKKKKKSKDQSRQVLDALG